MKTYFTMADPTNIEIGEEITLVVHLGTNKNAMSSGPDFRTVDCEAGIAVTITFFDISILQESN